MISAIPALSSAPSSVVPSLVTMSWPTRSASAGSCVGIEDLPRVARKQRSARPPRPRGRSATTPAPMTSGVVSTCAMSPTTGASTVPGKRREDRVALSFSSASDEPDLAELVDEQPREIELLLGARPLRDAVRPLRVDADVAQEPLEHVVRRAPPRAGSRRVL